MSVIISGTEFNKNEDTTQSASINIKSNQKTGVNQTSTTDFASVLVSGMQVDQSKLDSNTYTSLLSEADDVKAQIQSSATDAKASLKALFNRLSGADAVEIDQDGFNLTDATSEDMVNIVDRIKIELAAAGDSSQLVGSSISTDQIAQVVGSEGMAAEVENQMQQVGLPVTQDNLDQVNTALDKAAEASNLTENAKNYLVSNQMQPSIDNVYQAIHASGEGNVSQTSLSDLEWSQLQPQAEAVITQAGLTVNEQNLNSAKSMIEQQIPLTSENMSYKANLDELQTTDQQDLLTNIIENMAAGQSAGSTLLTDSSSILSQVVDAIQTINSATYSDVAALTQSGAVFTIDQLKSFMSSSALAIGQDASAMQVTATTQTETSTQLEDISNLQTSNSTQSSTSDQSSTSTQDDSDAVTDNYRMLQEIRITMTAQAGMFLVKNGVSLNTTPISQLAATLAAYDEQVTTQSLQLAQTDADESDTYQIQGTSLGDDQDAQQTIDDLNNEVESQSAIQTAVISYQTVYEVKKALFEMKYAPDVSIGTVLNETEEDQALTISDFAQTGSNLRQRFEQAGQTYEAVGTTNRSDLGDSVSKAVQASTDDILSELGLEDTQANRDAVRILGYNAMDITKESVSKVKEVYATVKSLVENMTPENVVGMIKQNINPMTADITTVNEYLQQQNSSSDSQTQEKYSRFLYKLDQTNELTEDERAQYIGIYKMMNVFTKDAGVAVGALMKQNAELTMQNLCTAYESRKSAGIDQTVDDEFAGIEGSVRYYQTLFSETADSITPSTLKTVDEEQQIPTRSIENFCESVSDAFDTQQEAEYYEDYLSQLRTVADTDNTVMQELTSQEQPVTINNLRAMEQIMQANYYGTVFDQEDTDSNDSVSAFLDQAGSGETLNAEYEKLAQNQEDILTEAINSDDGQDYETIETLRMRNQEIGLIQNLSTRNDYYIPYTTQDGIGTIHLTLQQEEEEKGKISIYFTNEELGEVSVEAKVNADQLAVFAVSDGTGSEETLSDRLNAAADQIGQDFDLKQTDVLQSQSDMVNRVSYDQSGETVPTNQLYQMAQTMMKYLVGNV